VRTNKRGNTDPSLVTRLGRPLKIGLLAPHQARILDLAGPWEVFTRANEILTEQHPNQKPAYDLKLATIDSSNLVHCFGQLRIRADGSFRSLGTGLDTLLVGGGRAPWELPKNEDFLSWLREMSSRVRRLIAIGSGAFFLAAAGLLQGKRATTHWRWAAIGLYQIASGQFQRVNNPRHYLVCGQAGPLGWEIPACIGAKLAEPEREVVALVGDLSFQFLIEELAVAAQHRVGFVMVLLNNAYLGLIRQAELGYSMDFQVQTSFANRNAPEIGDYGVDHVRAAEALGGIGLRVTDPKELASAVREAAVRWFCFSRILKRGPSPGGRKPGSSRARYRRDRLSFSLRVHRSDRVCWIGCEYKPSKDTVSSLDWLKGQL
jgi:putative intracellular protease/amidase